MSMSIYIYIYVYINLYPCCTAFTVRSLCFFCCCIVIPSDLILNDFEALILFSKFFTFRMLGGSFEILYRLRSFHLASSLTSRKYHPDKNLEASKEEASRRFREVAEAYAALNQFLG